MALFPRNSQEIEKEVGCDWRRCSAGLGTAAHRGVRESGGLLRCSHPGGMSGDLLLRLWGSGKCRHPLGAITAPFPLENRFFWLTLGTRDKYSMVIEEIVLFRRWYVQSQESCFVFTSCCRGWSFTSPDVCQSHHFSEAVRSCGSLTGLMCGCQNGHV